MATEVRKIFVSLLELMPRPQVPESDAGLKFIKSGYPVASHLGFQMCLYFNAWYVPFWIGVSCYSLFVKYLFLDEILSILCPVLVSFSFFLEGCRLYFGYYGNLFENAASLGAFFLITIFLQGPVIIVQLLSRRFYTQPIEWFFDILVVLFLFLELVTGWFAFRQISRLQAKHALLSPEYAEFKKKWK